MREERVPDWPLLKRVVESLGGVWSKGARGRRAGWDFPDGVDAAETIRLAQATGEVLDPRLAGFFETPRGLAELLVAEAGIPPGARVLEPSAGTGRLATAVRLLVDGAQIFCVELLEKNRSELERQGFEMIGADFLSMQPVAGEPFDAVVMNPPFRDEVLHIEHALGCLRPGGVLAAVMSGGIRYRETAPYARLRAWMEQMGATITDNPDGSFLEAGTGVRTVRVVVRVHGGT